jgi:hypothetical protein
VRGIWIQEGTMRLPLVVPAVPAACLLMCHAAAAEPQKACDYAGLSYSVGATVCECPSLKAEDLNDLEKERAHIFSRRLVCGPEQAWQDTKSTCIDAHMTIDAEKVYSQAVQNFCPTLPGSFGVSLARARKAVSRWAESLVVSTRSAVMSVTDRLCAPLRQEPARANETNP